MTISYSYVGVLERGNMQKVVSKGWGKEIRQSRLTINLYFEGTTLIHCVLDMNPHFV